MADLREPPCAATLLCSNLEISEDTDYFELEWPADLADACLNVDETVLYGALHVFCCDVEGQVQHDIIECELNVLAASDIGQHRTECNRPSSRKSNVGHP